MHECHQFHATLVQILDRNPYFITGKPIWLLQLELPRMKIGLTPWLGSGDDFKRVRAVTECE